MGLAKRTGAKILQASTSEICGNPEIHPQKESYVGSVNPIGPRACYDEGKRAAETLFFSYKNQHDVDIKGLLEYLIHMVLICMLMMVVLSLISLFKL